VESPLSRRETEVLRLAARGADVADIARELYLTKGTVRNYLTTVVAKLNARNRVEIAAWAWEHGAARGRR
jgi:two-component system response regulator DesR